MLKVRSVSPTLLVLVSALVLVSCVTTDPYPEEWSPIVAAERGDCSALAGTFDNGYSASSHDAIPMKGGLIALLIGPAKPSESSVAKSVTRVTIKRPSPDLLMVSGFHYSEPVRQEERRISGKSCSGKGLSIAGKFSGTNAENIVGFVSASGHLQRTANGDLVGRIRSTFTGVALLVPMTSSATSWYRFRQIEPESAPTDSLQ